MSDIKKRYCENLIATGQVRPYDVIRHSYTDGGERKMAHGVARNISPTLDTRCDCFGVVVEIRHEEKP